MQDQTLKNSQVDQEISGRPWWKTCLILTLIIAVVFFIVSILFVRFVGGSGPRYSNTLPETFPTNFLLYRMGLVKHIVYYPASEKDKPLRLVMTPVRMLASMSSNGQSVADSIDQFLGIIRTNETVTLTWSDVEGNADEVLSFYAASLRSAGVIDPQMRQTTEKDVSQIIGTTNTGAKVNVLLVDDKATPKIDAITVVVEYPVPKK